MSRLIALLLLPASLLVSGCAVVTVTSAAVSVAATAVEVGAKTVGLAADATIGTARLVGRAVTSDEAAAPAQSAPLPPTP